MTTANIITIGLDDEASMDPADFIELIHRVDGIRLLGNVSITDSTAIAVVDDPDIDDTEHALPMDQHAAHRIISDDGFATVVLKVGQDDFINSINNSGSALEESQYDLLHKRCFSFGLPHDCSFQIIGVSGDDLIIKYTTKIDGWTEEDHPSCTASVSQ